MIESKEIYLSIKQEKFNYKSKENKDYLITLSIIADKINIKVDEINNPLIFYKISISLEEFYSLSNSFEPFKSINEIYDNLKELIQTNINNLDIINNNSSLELIIPFPKYSNKKITFILSQSKNSKEEDILVMSRLIKELKEKNKILELNLKEIKENINNNILLLSNQSDSLFNNLLKISPFVNNITVLTPNFMKSKFNFQNIQKFKIIIYDMRDGGFQLEEKTREIKQYLLNNGNIIVTHDHWTGDSYKGELYELLGAKLRKQKYTTVKKAKVLQKEHPIFTSYFFMDESIFDIAETHKSDTIYPDKEYLKDLLIELMDNIHGEYLMVKRFGKGKLIYWNVGHNKNLTDYEQDLFLNIIAWIYKDN